MTGRAADRRRHYQGIAGRGRSHGDGSPGGSGPLPQSRTPCKLADAACLVFLGAQALVHSRRGRARIADTPGLPTGSPWRTGLVTNLFNPKIAVFHTGLLPALAPGLSPRTGMAPPVFIHAMLTAVWLGSYGMLLASISAFSQKPSVRCGMDRITDVILIEFGLKVAASRP